MPFDPAAMLGLMIPFVALSIPIVALLTKHQREMAEMYASRQTTGTAEIAALRAELAAIKDMVGQLVIAQDGVGGTRIAAVERAPVPPAMPVREQERLQQPG